MDRNSKIAKNVPKMFQDSRCLTETPRFLDEIPRFPIDRNSKISEIPKPKVDSESAPIFPLVGFKVPGNLKKYLSSKLPPRELENPFCGRQRNLIVIYHRIILF